MQTVIQALDPRLSNAGFSLVELLVGFTLLSLIAVMAFGALQFGNRVWERGVVRGASRDDIQAVQSLIRRQLSESVARLNSDGAGVAPLFRGDPTMIEFVAPLPADSAGGGLVRQRLTVAGTGNAARLLLSWLPGETTGRDAEPDAWTKAETVVLLDGVAALDNAYFDIGGREDSPVWRDRWELNELPALVRVRLRFAADRGRRWPVMLIAPRAAPRPSAAQLSLGTG